MNPLDVSNIVFPKSIEITDQEIDVSVLTERQKLFYISLFGKIIEHYRKSSQKRMIVGIAGPTGAGKSVVAALFLDFARHLELPFRVATLGIDAYHYPNQVLEATFCEGVPLSDLKGMPNTYDVAKLKTDLDRFLSGDAMSFPVYSRETHNPKEHYFDVREEDALLILEGQWILYDKEGWEKIVPLLGYSLFITAEKSQVQNTVVVRQMRGGKTEEEANAHYDKVDAKDHDLIMGTKAKAAEVIETYHTL